MVSNKIYGHNPSEHDKQRFCMLMMGIMTNNLGMTEDQVFEQVFDASEEKIRQYMLFPKVYGRVLD